VTENASVTAHVGRPLLAATLIVVDRSRGEPRILMGRRRPDAVFLPDKYVFPGGRLEVSDGDVPPVGELPPHDAGCLARGLRGADRARAARAFVTAAIRETFEETGYLVAVDTPNTASNLPGTAAPPDWRALLEGGIRPDLGQLRYVARAITPPGRPRRYDTRFFLAEASAVRAIYPRTDGELSEIGWFGLDRLSAYDLPSITRLVLDDLVGALSQRQSPDIPFYFWRSGAFRRALLSQRGGPA
jgi:8-oxo-dGTP pyrophosphatase MutT (NUDIX family)